MIDQQMLAAFGDELDSMEKEALLGAAKTLGKSLLKRFSGAASKVKKPLGRGRPSRPIPAPSRGSGDLKMLRDMDPASQAAATTLKGPIGDAYRASAKTKIPTRAGASSAGGAPRMPGGGGGFAAPATIAQRPARQIASAGRGGVSGAKTQILPPTQAAAAPAGATNVVNTLKSTAKVRGRPTGIITAAQSRAAPTRALLGNIGRGKGTGLSAANYPKGNILRGRGGNPQILPGGKPVYAHVMAKFAALHYQSAMVQIIRAK